ncbi:MAG TPA: tRNA (guanosine(46)-N7)-methyltransferase TrmB [Aestuariivirga sp.]|nr:tRNA (guanosine(46)-N7)-methyltransferase TrmB [Aestuariivirga sp.]
MSEAPRKRQFYGRRKGHALRRHHSGLMEQLLPHLRVELGDALAGMGDRRWLEIGFGGGEHLAHQAQLHPGVSFLGAEPFVNGIAKLLALVEEKDLRNVLVHDGDARDLLEVLPEASFERIYLLFPDPWPKARHNKRRFVSAENVSHFHRILKQEGLFLFASDIEDYVSWTREHVAAHGGFREEGDPVEPFENWIQTRYEAKARREGRGSTYLTFRRR